MFFAGESVWCSRFGFGEVVTSGDDPHVQFLGGPNTRVTGELLRFIPSADYDREVANRRAIERWLDLRIHGRLLRPAHLLPRPAFELETAMRHQVMASPRIAEETTGVISPIGQEMNNPM